MLGCPLSTLTGGSWEHTEHKQSKVLVGHLRLTSTEADRVAALSGTRGLFATKLTSLDSRPEVAWIPRAKDESIEEYMRRVAGEAHKRKVPQAIRQGGGSDLGLVGVSASEFSTTGPKIWLCHFVPKSWT